jgi:hypothetical protein
MAVFELVGTTGLDIKQLRAEIPDKGYHFFSKKEHFDVKLERTDNGKSMIVKGTCRFAFIKDNKAIPYEVPLYGCLCKFKQSGSDGFNLKKRYGRNALPLCFLNKDSKELTPMSPVKLSEEIYRYLDDLVLSKVLKIFLATLLDINMDEMEYVKDTNADESKYEVINPGKWGIQSCKEFEWSESASKAIANGVEKHKWCRNCARYNDCGTAISIAAKRKSTLPLINPEEDSEIVTMPSTPYWFAQHEIDCLLIARYDYGLTNSDVEAIEPVRCNPLGDPRELKKEYQRIIAKYPNLSDYIAFGAEREEVLA